jgi:hypothetical protein
MVTKKNASSKSNPLAIPKASAADLRGRQSIRVSFRLTPKCIEAMNILGSHLRLKPKSLFDHMVQEPDTLAAIATKTKATIPEDLPRLVKTYVISRDAAEVLDRVAQARKISRDTLVETSVQHLMPLIHKAQVRHSARKTMVSKMEHHLAGGKALLEDMIAELGENDPMCDKMKLVMATYDKAFANISAFIAKGANIEGFDARG